jgi:hypothetical protein
VNSRGYTPLMVAVFADLPQVAAALLEVRRESNFVANPPRKSAATLRSVQR